MREAEKERDRAAVLKAVAGKEWREANTLKESTEQEIAKKVDYKSEEVKKQLAVKVGALTFALSLYCFIMTAIWLADRWEIVKTVPQWFVNRWGNLQTIWGGIASVHEWAYKLLQPHMSEFIAKAIPFVLLLAVVAAIGYFVVFKGIEFLIDKLGDLWRHYSYQDKTLLKTSTTVAIVTASIPLAVLVAGTGFGHINVVSWWLLFALILNVAYHGITYKIW